jgi:septum site-determining protein MinC
VTKPDSQISLPLPEQSASAAATPESAPATIDFKGISLPVMQVALSRLEPEQIAAAVKTRFGKNASRFFDNDAAVLDLNKVEADGADWVAVKEQLAGASLQLVAVYGGSSELQASARSAGLAVIDTPPVSRAAPKAKEEVPVLETVVEPKPLVEEKPAAPEPAPLSSTSAAAMVIDKPLRSGQRIYARGGDLVVLAMVSAGAEVIADGNIHIYAPLRGRALAGAQGDQKARIFTTSFEAELVSIGGVYRTFESPQQFGKLAGQPVQVSLIADESKPDAEPKLNVASLSTR